MIQETDVKKSGKRKVIIKIIITSGILLCCWIVIRKSGTLDYVSISTTSMMPLYKIGQTEMISRFKAYDRGSIICYNGSAVNFPDGIYPGQLKAKGGDTIEVRAGVVFVNGKLADDTTKICFEWIR